MTQTRVNEIDLLRFLAALAVVFFHYAFRGYAADNMTVMPYLSLAPFAKYGFLGVQLFFMISGFVILMTATGNNVTGFVGSRVIRLYPAYWASCTLTFLVVLYFGAPHFSATWHQYLINMSMFNGFMNVDHIDGAYWSLVIELRFYLLVILVLAVRQIHRAEAFLIGWLIISIVMQDHPNGKLRSWLITDFSAWFIAGAMCYYIWRDNSTIKRYLTLAGAYALALYQSLDSLSGFNTTFNTTLDPDVVATVVTSFFAVMLLIGHRRTGILSRMNWILAGALTYPLYLVHQYIGFTVFNHLYPAVNAHILFWGTLAGALTTALLINRLVEKPVTAFMKRQLRRWSSAKATTN